MNERDLKSVLEEAASAVRLPDRFQRPSQLVAEIVRRRPGLIGYLRGLKLGQKLEIAAACTLLVGLIGVAGLRGQRAVPDPGSDGPGILYDSTRPARLIGAGGDATVGLAVTLEPKENGDWRLTSVIRNRSRETIDLVYECSHLIRLLPSFIAYDCSPLPNISLKPGESRQDERTVGDVEAAYAKLAFLEYLGSAGHRTPKFILEPAGLAGIATLTTGDVVERLMAAGLKVTAPVESSMKLFGANHEESLMVEGQTVIVYSFANKAAAEKAFKTGSDPQQNTISWAVEPQFVVKGNLLIGIFSNDSGMTNRVMMALAGTGAGHVDRPPDGTYISREEAVRAAGVNDQSEVKDALFIERFELNHPTDGRKLIAVWRVEIVSKADKRPQGNILVDAVTGKVLLVSNPPSGYGAP